MTLLLLLCLAQAPDEARTLDLNLRAGLAVPLLSADPGVVLGAGPALQLEALRRLTPWLGVGLHGSGSWHPFAPVADVTLADHRGSAWVSNAAVALRFSALSQSTVVPFAVVRAGWMFAGLGYLAHGPMFGLGLGAEVHLTSRLALGLTLDVQAAFLSSKGATAFVNGYVLRPDPNAPWGNSWVTTSLGSGLLHLRFSL